MTTFLCFVSCALLGCLFQAITIPEINAGQAFYVGQVTTGDLD